MIEQVGRGITFAGYFADRTTREGASGLTVSVDVRRGGIKLVTDGAATELGGGLYSYALASGSVSQAGIYSAVFKTTSDTVEAKHVPVLWAVGMDWVENVSHDLDDIHLDIADARVDISDVHADVAHNHTDITSVYNLLHGPGATQCSLKVTDDAGSSLDHVKVWITSDSDPAHVIAGVFESDSNGMVNGVSGVWLDVGTTVYVWCDSGCASFANPSSWVVGQGVRPHVISGVRRSSGGSPTFGELRGMLRTRLNDSDMGNYADSELNYCINLAYRETQIASKCQKVSRSIPVLCGQHTYFTDQIFEALEVSCGGVILDKVGFGDFGVSLEAWNGAGQGSPSKWAQVYGSWIRVHPTPDADGTMTVHGYGIGAELSADGDSPSAVPVGYAASAILDRAEAEARKMRASHANNASLAGVLAQSWQGWVERIRESVG